MVRNDDDTFSLFFEEPLEVALTGQEEKDIENIIYKYAKVFARYIRKYPEQWYMFRRFWEE